MMSLRVSNYLGLACWGLTQTALCSSCCVTCCCPGHVCELQGVVIRVFDSPLSRKGMFPVSRHFQWDKKKCAQFPLQAAALVSQWDKKGYPYWGCNHSCQYHIIWRKALFCAISSISPGLTAKGRTCARSVRGCAYLASKHCCANGEWSCKKGSCGV